MGKFRLPALLIFCLILSACSYQTKTQNAINNETVQPVMANAVDTVENKPVKEEKAEPIVEVEVVQETDTKISHILQLPTQPEQVNDQEVKPQILDKLDNTKYAWWMTLNKQHNTPGIPEKARSLISKYDGIFTGDTSKKVIYITFDEGYENGFTGRILDTLKENDVKSIFFVTGPYIKQNADLVKRMLNEGHLVGNHTINHFSLPEISDASLQNELAGLEKQFSSEFNKRFKYMRPPKGEYSERVLAAAKEIGYKTVFWSYAYADYDVNKQKGADHAYKMVMDNLHNGEVLLLHAVSKDNTEALDRIIKAIKAEGYEILPFDL